MTQMKLTLFAKPEASAGDVNTSSVALRELTRKSGPLKEPQGMLFFSVVLPLDYPKDVLGVHNPVLLSVELDLRPRILANDHHVSNAHLHAVLELAHRDDLCALGLLLGCVGKHYARSGRLLRLDLLNQRTRP